MSRESIIECSFFIPVRRDASLSDGQLHGRKVWEWLQLELFTRFGGFTRSPGKYAGSYVDPDTKQQVSDESRQYVVAVPESELGQLRSVLSAACVLFQQKCIYLSVAGHVEFVQSPAHESDQPIP